jgi:TolB-like protein
VIRSLNIWFAALLTLALMCGARAAQAQDDKKRVSVLKFQGPSAAAFQAQVSQALKQRSEVELVPATEVKETAARLGNSLESDTEYREVGEALELSAYIEGTVVKKARDLQVTVRVRDASSGAVVHEETWARRRSKVKTLKPVVWSALGPAIAETSAPTPKAKPKPKPTKPEPVAELDEEEEEEERPRTRPTPRAAEERERPSAAADEDEDDDEAPKARRRGGKTALHPALVLAVGPRLMWRKLKYEGDTNFNTYRNEAGNPAFNLALSAQYYPGAHSSTKWYADLGLDVNFDYTLGLKSKQGGEELGTTAYDMGIGAIYRIPLGAFEPRLRLGYIKQVFEVDVDENTLLPALDYSAIRLGVGTAINIVESFAFDVSFAYLLVLGTGELEEPRFGEDVEASGWEAGAGFLLRFAEVYGARLALDYRRYKYDFGLSDSDSVQRLPRSGKDGYLRLGLFFVYSLPGVP